jgi:hypothetical protein
MAQPCPHCIFRLRRARRFAGHWTPDVETQPQFRMNRFLTERYPQQNCDHLLMALPLFRLSSYPPVVIGTRVQRAVRVRRGARLGDVVFRCGTGLAA